VAAAAAASAAQAAANAAAASSGSSVRHEAYAYPTAEAVEASRLKAKKVDEALEELATTKIPEARLKIEAANLAQDAAIELGRDPDAKKLHGKEVLRERTASAKKALTLVQRELLGLEAKASQLAREKARSAEMRGREEVAFARVEAEGLWGLRVTPAFDPDPLVEKAAGAVKKLSDEEEKAIRSQEVLDTVREKKEREGARAKDAAQGGAEEQQAVGGGNGGTGGSSGGASASASGVARMTSKLDFIQSLDATMGRAASGGSSSPRLASGRKPPGRLNVNGGAVNGEGGGEGGEGGSGGGSGLATPSGKARTGQRLFPASPLLSPARGPTGGPLPRRQGGSKLGGLASLFDPEAGGSGHGDGRRGGGRGGDGFGNGGFAPAAPADSPPRRPSFNAFKAGRSPQPSMPAFAASSSSSSSASSSSSSGGPRGSSSGARVDLALGSGERSASASQGSVAGPRSAPPGAQQVGAGSHPALPGSRARAGSGGAGGHRIRDYMEHAANSAEQEKMFRTQVGPPRSKPPRPEATATAKATATATAAASSLAAPAPPSSSAAAGPPAESQVKAASVRRFAKYAV
jgi:hypothetical protein